jgi:hypothetical protein
MSTISGKAVDLLNVYAGSGFLDVALCGYGAQVPRGPQGILPNGEDTLEIDEDGNFSFQVAGNDTILPPGTYYTITVRNGNGDIIQVNAYQFTDLEEYTLSGPNPAPPFDPSQQPPPGIPAPIQNLLLIIAYDPAAVFPGDTYTSWEMWLTGDCAPTFINLVDGNLYTVILYQDSVGGHQFFWPSNVFNAVPVDPDPASTTVQTFVAIDGDLYPIGPGTYYP